MTAAWQQSLSRSIRDLPALLTTLELNALPSEQQQLLACDDFALCVPEEFIARMEKGNPRDPLLLQVFPQGLEILKTPGYTADPLSEKQYNPVPGLLHKYPIRVLLTLTGACAINCRYCFRRHFPYQDNLPGRVNMDRIVQYIRDDENIDEVIFSGGDPLLLKDHLMAELVARLESINQLKRIRIHTRLPIVIPSRVTEEWMNWIEKTRFQVVIVLHSNHPNEIDQTVIDALNKLQSTKAVLLNQSVLLKDINDDAAVLAQLSTRLFEAGVLPYYLHLMDKVQGAAHFDVSEGKAQVIMSALKEKLPGFLVPKLAQEKPGLKSKYY